MLLSVVGRFSRFKSVNNLGVAWVVCSIAEPFDVDACLFHVDSLVLVVALVCFLEEIR